MSSPTIAPHVPADGDTPPPRRRSPAAALGTGLLVGIAAGVVGLLPWLTTDRRLPLQNLWSEQRLPGEMPVSLLPLSQYYVVPVLAMMLVGAVLAGLVVRALPRSGPALGGAFVGWLVVALAASGQSAWTVAEGIERSSRGEIYLYAVLGALAASLVVCFVALPVSARGSRPAAVPWLALAAVLTGSWLGVFATGFGHRFDESSRLAATSSHWVAAALVGVTLAWCAARGGWGSLAAAWFVGLALLWVVPAAVTAVGYAGGSARSAQHAPDPIRDLASGGVRVFLRALEPSSRTLGDLAVALVVGVLGAVLARAITKRA
ncbi:hypothetical protein [Knoellia koreensis]|uniref:Uncharacterized protein n=1 Tax=Knoellia koreensis TaxID=2730921 RepID=A0A849HHG4_9MICO|nr:hypothetical protein [Knoellia sp. DB2414S]NNM46848.1 hypothetical protein [Knoellia sp. DB2414S]